jgi:hypothetical protein
MGGKGATQSLYPNKFNALLSEMPVYKQYQAYLQE